MTDSGKPVAIKARVANYGTFSETFNVRFKISPDYNCTRQVTLPAGLTSQVVFDTWTPLIRSNHTAQCSTELSIDEYPLDNYKNDSIFAVVRDIWAEAVVEPADTATLGRSFIPTVRFANLGNLAATFPAWLKITWGVMQVYLDTVIVNLAQGETANVNFMNWRPDSAGIHFTETHCQLPVDMHTANDIAYGQVLIQTYTPWFQISDLLEGTGKKVKQGGSLVYVPDNAIYALKGSNTNEFFRYNIATDTWTQICSIPYAEKIKKVKNGAALCYGNGYVYAFKGNNTNEFWRYSIATDSWFLKQSLPLGISLRRIKAGSGLVYVTKGDSNFVYALKANKTNEFYAYWVEMDTWLERKPVPATYRPMAAGSCITYDGVNTIYALEGKTNEFYAYDILADNWSVKPMMPYYGSMNKKKKVKDGGALAANQAGLVYAFKGNNTNEFWAYSVDEDTWLVQQPIPEGNYRKRIKAGGALCYDNSTGNLYGFKGGNTNEFWQFVPVMQQIASKRNSPSGIMGNKTELNSYQFSLKISPNPITRAASIKYTLTEPDNVYLKLFDVSGKLVKIISHANSKSGTLTLNRDKLASGIYILRLETSRGNLTRKIIFSR
jgi:Secretion system C-terminal sorting domain